MTRRKTDAEFRKKLHKAQGNAIIPLERYKNARAKIKVKCHHCGFVWKARPANLYKGCNCPHCSVRRRRKSDSKFRRDLHKAQGNAIIPLEKYKGSQTKIKVKCRHCGFIWKAFPTSLRQGHGCPHCAAHKRSKPDSKFRKELFNALGDAVIPLEKYKNSYTKIKVKCRHCGFVWNARPHALYNGHSCPHCAARKRSKPDSKFRRDLHKVHGNAIIPLERYKNCRTKIRVKCNRCGLVWKALPDGLCHGTGCPRCALRASHNRRGHRKTNAKFRKDIRKIHGNAIIPLEKYKGADTKIKVKCRRCGFVWRARPHSLCEGSGCPRCNQSSSYGEKYIYRYLCHHLHAHFDYGYIIPANGLHFDFWIPSMKLAIEYDGDQHFKYVPYFCDNDPKQFKSEIHRDLCKNHYCLRHHIILIRIQNFHNDGDYKRIHHITYYILSRVFSAYRRHHLHTHIYRFNANNHGHLLCNYKKNA